MTIRMMSLGEHEDRQRKIDDLDFWKYAYCVALSGMCTGPDIVDPIVVSQVIARLADLAVEEYRAKREEMGKR